MPLRFCTRSRFHLRFCSRPILRSSAHISASHLRFTTSPLTRSLSPRPNSSLRFCSRCHEAGVTQRHKRRVIDESKLVTAEGSRLVNQMTSIQTKTTTQHRNSKSQWLSHDVKPFLAVVSESVAAQNEVFTESEASGLYDTRLGIMHCVNETCPVESAHARSFRVDVSSTHTSPSGRQQTAYGRNGTIVLRQTSMTGDGRTVAHE